MPHDARKGSQLLPKAHKSRALITYPILLHDPSQIRSRSRQQHYDQSTTLISLFYKSIY
jgi:hypothetical protein